MVESKYKSVIASMAAFDYDVEFTNGEEFRLAKLSGIPFPSNDELIFFIGRNKKCL